MSVRSTVKEMGAMPPKDLCIEYIYQHGYRLGIIHSHWRSGVKRITMCGEASKILGKPVDDLNSLSAIDLSTVASVLAGREK